MFKRILFVFTSADTTLTGAKTGWYLPEAAHPYYILAPKYEIDFASPKGGFPPADPDGAAAYPEDVTKFLEDPATKEQLATTKKLSDVSAADYDAIFYVGGIGPVLDLATDPINAKFASDFFRAGKLTTAVCHGPIALTSATDAQGVSLFKGRKATAFTNYEEELQGKLGDVPFLVESRIVELGGLFEKAGEPWLPHVVQDGILITGQNPASAHGVGEAIDRALSA
ncbi:ThiJ/PfpI [Trametes versicolor FP-101664 SS1]|uniref:ThiJ/PfpI n=1 Tax=Trametes versicolor (strain FP-101664) TaxID=717944 RepID=UPI00046238D8|nr:ThiJ/PfpI [Trametes versicolor FP-101664 SS1]EIW61444.1 ThiJ/PfpI [Trametes versicolor FP-101664 SS1]